MSCTRIRCACGCNNQVDVQYHRDGKMYAWPCIWQKVREDDLATIRAAIAAGERQS